jgi:serine/threonine protein kinase
MIAALQHRAGELIQERYEVLGVLGSGAFGTVYQCRDLELNALVAIKELHVLDEPRTVGNERTLALDQFRSEALHLSNLRHPNIVSGHYQPHNGTWLICPVCGFAFKGTPACPVHNAEPIVLKQRNYLVMEYLDGPNLSQAAERAGGVLSIELALRYIRQTAEALKMIHARGWVHRDVKPENIRVRAATDEAVLLDFGIATESGAAGDFSTRAQRHTHGGGTLGYAPDSTTERRHPDARSDVHALGMTLYRMVSGRDPLESDELAELRKFAPRYFNTKITPALEDLILRAINADASRRPADGGAFLCELDALDGTKTQAQLDTLAAHPQSTPSLPVPLNKELEFRSGERASTLRELATLCDHHPEEARELLFDGHLEKWLLENNRGILARRAREIREKYTRRARGLEAFLQATGEVAPPQLRADAGLLDFGEIEAGQTKTRHLNLRNPGRGHLFGVLRASHHSLHVPGEFDGNNVSIPVTLDARRLQRGAYSGSLIVDSSSGELTIPFRAQITKTTDAALSTVVFWSCIGMLGAFALRTLPLASQSSTPGWTWLSWQQNPHSWPAAPLFGLVFLGVLAPFIAGESLRRKSCSFALSVGLFTLFMSLLCGVLGLEILIGGDGVLRPVMEPLARNWAAGAWMFAGGVLGAAYGTLRRWSDIFSPRLVQILFGWLAAMAILYGLLAAAQILAPPLH